MTGIGQRTRGGWLVPGLACLALLAGFVAAPARGVALAQDRRPVADEDIRRVLADRWGARLSELAPSRPEAYFELAEEIDDQRPVGPAAAGDRVAEAERALVRRLFALAGRLDPDLAGSAARAIADLSPDVRERRRLLVVADLLDGDRILRGRPPRLEGVPTGRGSAAPADVLQAASAAIARYRRGAGEAALEELVDHPREQVSAAFQPWPGGLAGFEQDCRRQPGVPRVRRLLVELSAELRMLEGDAADWTAIVRSGGGAPLEEVDVDDLDRLFAVDASMPLWRNGRWVAR